MARRATDLLDVFRAERRPNDGGDGGTRAAAKPPRERRPFEGLLLLPRQILLGSSVLVLLLVFAFVLGLSVGRRGTTDEATLSARARTGGGPTADARRIFVAGRVPLVDPVRQTANEPARVFADLTGAKGVPRDLVWIVDDPSHQHLVVLLGPFADKAQAMDYLVRASLVTARLGGAQAFHAPEYRSMTPADLPAKRIPAR